MDVENDLAELDAIINRISTVERFALWETIDALRTNRGLGDLIKLSPDVTQARAILMPFWLRDENRIYLYSLQDRLRTMIKDAVKDLPLTMRDSAFRWQHPATGIISQFIPPPFFLD